MMMGGRFCQNYMCSPRAEMKDQRESSASRPLVLEWEPPFAMAGQSEAQSVVNLAAKSGALHEPSAFPHAAHISHARQSTLGTPTSTRHADFRADCTLASR